MAPRTVLPSTASTTGSGTSMSVSTWPVSTWPDVVGLNGCALVEACARSASQAPIAASTPAASILVSTRQIVALDGGTGTADAAPHWAYTDTSRSAGVS